MADATVLKVQKVFLDPFFPFWEDVSVAPSFFSISQALRDQLIEDLSK